MTKAPFLPCIEKSEISPIRLIFPFTDSFIKYVNATLFTHYEEFTIDYSNSV